MRRPVADNVPITQNFGKTSFSNWHNGIDFSGRFDRNVYAPESGSVAFEYQSTLGGNVAIIRGASGEHRLAHLSDVHKKSGHVNEAEVIGVMGATGKATAVHLHWGLKRGGQYVNPLEFLSTNTEDPDMAKPSPEDVVAVVRDETGIAPPEDAGINRNHVPSRMELYALTSRYNRARLRETVDENKKLLDERDKHEKAFTKVVEERDDLRKKNERLAKALKSHVDEALAKSEARPVSRRRRGPRPRYTGFRAFLHRLLPKKGGD